MHEKQKRDRSMHRCLTKTKITTGHPLSIKLQRKHHRKDSTETVQWQEKRGRIWRATCSDGAVEWKSFSLNKHERDGSHNHREVEAGGWHIWAGGGPALILWTEGSSHSGVNWETSAICATKAEWAARWWGPGVPLSQMYQPTPACAPTRSA